METKRWSQRVAIRVRRAVKASGLSNARIVELTGIPAASFSRRMNGQDPWNTVQLEKVGKAIAIDPDKFMGSTGEEAAS